MAYIENPSAAGSMNETELFTLSDLKLFGGLFRFLLGPWLLAPGTKLGTRLRSNRTRPRGSPVGGDFRFR